MVRYRGAKLRIIRRLGILSGFTSKLPKMRSKTPGEHGKIIFARNKRSSLKDDYKERLLEKQKLRFNYGLTESQLIRYYKLAKKSSNLAGMRLLELIESRLDCIVYRLGFTPSIPSARQAITHGHILVNSQRVNIPSFGCQKGDIISIAEKASSLKLLKDYLIAKLETDELLDRRSKQFSHEQANFKSILPEHLEITGSSAGRILNIVKRKDVLIRVNELKIVEYYSKQC